MRFECTVNELPEHPVITLKDTVTGCEAEIYTFGGLLNALKVVGERAPRNIVDGFSSVADAKKNITNGFKSAKLCPFVCRLHKGSYQFGGKNYQVHKHYLAGHAIHGLVYDSIYEAGNTHSGNSHASVTLSCRYEGTDDGYPFPFSLILDWTLESTAGGNRLTISTTITHHNEEALLFADGWHPYFTLGGSVDTWSLQFNSHTMLEYNSELLPTGKTIPDERFEKGMLLKDVVLDNSFEFTGAEDCAPFCVLHNNELRLTIEPDSSYPILQIYTPPHRKSIAIENLSGAPDNFNNGIGLLQLQPGEPKIFTTAYTIEML